MLVALADHLEDYVSERREDPVSTRDLALFQLVIASTQSEAGDQAQASSYFRKALANISRVGDAGEDLRPIAFSLGTRVTLS